MAEKLIKALGRGIGKTVREGAQNIGRRATRDIPTPSAVYNLGMGIGPMLRNTVASYQKDSDGSSGSKSSPVKNAEIKFAKDNATSFRHISSQLSTLNVIMSDIRKISMAQLQLARVSVRNRGFGDRSSYLETEKLLESGNKASLSGSDIGSKNGREEKSGLSSMLDFIKNNPVLSAVIAGGLYAFRDEIGKIIFGGENKKILGNVMDKFATGLGTFLGTALDRLRSELRKEIKDMSGIDIGEGNLKNQGKTVGYTALGGLAAARIGRFVGMRSPLKLGLAGAIAAYHYTTSNDEANQVYRQTYEQAIQNGASEAEAKQMAEQAAQKAGPTVLGTAAMGALGLAAPYAIGKGITAAGRAIGSRIFGTGIPSAPSGAVPTTGPGMSGAAERVPMNKRTLADGSYRAYRSAQPAMQATEMAATNSRWTRFLAFIERKAPKLFAKVGARLAVAGAGLAVPFAGWLMTALTVLGSISLAWDVYTLWKEFNGDPLADASEDGKSTGEVKNIGAHDAPANDGVQRPEISTTPGGAAVGIYPNAGKRNSDTGASKTAPAGSAPPPAGNSAFSSPLPGAKVSKGRFGENRGKHVHTGVDISSPEGTPVLAVGDGTVTAVGANGGNGRYIEVTHADGTKSRYSHLSVQDVAQGTAIKKGDAIGKVGKTGQAGNGGHLHLDIIDSKGKYVDPRQHVSGIPPYTGKDQYPDLGKIDSIEGGKNPLSGQFSEASSPSAPGENSTQAVLERALGFDLSKMGVNLNDPQISARVGEIKNLEDKFKSAGLQLAAAANGQNNKQTPVAQRNRSGDQKTVANTQTPEKDVLFNFTNGMYMPGQGHAFY